MEKEIWKSFLSHGIAAGACACMGACFLREFFLLPVGEAFGRKLGEGGEGVCRVWGVQVLA